MTVDSPPMVQLLNATYADETKNETEKDPGSDGWTTHTLQSTLSLPGQGAGSSFVNYTVLSADQVSFTSTSLPSG